jgi:hypothetical protein
MKVLDALKGLQTHKKGFINGMIDGIIGILILLVIAAMIPGIYSQAHDAAPAINATNTALATASANINTQSTNGISQIGTLIVIAVVLLVVGAVMAMRKGNR